MSQIAIVLTLWLALNLGVLGLAWLRYVAKARWLRGQVTGMIEAAERHANSRAVAGVGAGSGRLPD
jgi:hypothetical protein